jgi:apolipoprotein N-acyltransferase
MEKLNLNKENLRKFGITMSAAFAVIALIIFLKNRHSPVSVSAISASFLFIALIAPGSLKWVYIAWMRFAFILGWINTRIILCILFYLFFTPVSIGIKILRKDLLDRRIRKKSDSYWRRKEKALFNPLDYERQF